MAQIIVAVQMVYEERFVMRYNVHPLVAVGLEGELEANYSQTKVSSHLY